MIFVAIGAIPAGLMFILAPDGSLMGMSTDFLDNSIFTTFLIPGLFLFAINGITGLVCGIFVWRQHHLSYLMGTGLGLFLIAWIIIQILIIGFSPLLQITFLLVGLIELGLSLQLYRYQLVR